MAEVNSEEEIVQYSSWKLVKDIFELLQPYRGRFWLASFISMLGDLAWLYPAFAFASIVTFLTHYQSGQSLNTVWTVLGLWLAATVVRSLSQYFSKFIGFQISERLAINSTLRTVQHLFKLDMAWHERENSGNKIKRIQNGSDGFNRILRLWFDHGIEIAVNLIAINIIIAQFDRTILLVLGIFLVTYFSISAVMIRRAAKAAYRVSAQEENVNGLLFEAVNNIRTIKVMAMAQTLYAALIKETGELFNKLGFKIFWNQSRQALLSFWAVVFKIGGIILIFRGILDGYQEIGFLILFNSYFSDLQASIDRLSTANIDFVNSKMSVMRMKSILNEPTNIDDEAGKVSFSPNWKKITIKNVSFAYGENQVLNDISFDVRRGEKVGVVGVSGAGKSTLFKLLLKEREEFAGDILFDDTSIKQIKKNDYFKQVSVVLQDTEVFNFSLRDNIIITNDAQKTNEELLDQALATAHITELVDKLPQGLDTLIGEKGVKLSGGERQRLGIARAIFKQPEILLLDEATSHLDLESEEKIRDSLHKFFENVTAIVIAHRLTTIREMDKILVIENGRLIESGNFEELLAKQGRFYELWEKQKF